MRLLYTLINVRLPQIAIYGSSLLFSDPQYTLMLALNVDALSMVHRDQKVIDLYTILVESCCRYLRLLESIVAADLAGCDEDYTKISEPETFHFFPEHCGHFITRSYSKNDTDDSLGLLMPIL